MPRITGIVGQPPAGQRWDDPRVAGAVELAVRLADVWEALHLQEIVPSARPEVQGDRQYFVYDLVTRGGTRIVWGAAPQASVPGEDDFAVKLAAAQGVRRSSTARSIRSNAPGTINVRGGIAGRRRGWSKKPAARRAAKTRSSPRSRSATDDPSRSRSNRSGGQTAATRSAGREVGVSIAACSALRISSASSSRITASSAGASMPMRTRAARNFHHGDGDLVANENPLADFARDDEHVGRSPSRSARAAAARIWYSALTGRLRRR